MSQADELYTLFAQRQSDRRFDPSRPVEEETVRRIVEQAMNAPSAVNEQPWQVVIVTEPEMVERVSKAARKGALGQNKFIEQATAHLILVAENPQFLARWAGKARGVDYVQNDLGIFTAYLTLAAAAEGLGSCIIGWLNGAAIARTLGIPLGKKVFLDIVLGYSLEPLRPKKRKSPDKVIHHNHW